MQLATVGLMCAWLMGGQGTTPASGQGAAAPPDRSPAPADSTARADKPAPAPSASAGRPGGANPNTAEPELPVALPPAATPVVPGTEAPPPPAALKTRLDRVRAENADLPVPTKIEVQNQMGKRFRLVAASFVIDGAPASELAVPKGKELSLKNRPISVLVPAGDHVLTATLTFEGRNVGPFTYMDDTRYRVESTIPFSTSHVDGPATIQVVASERKGANLPFERIPMLTMNLANPPPAADANQMATRPAAPASAAPGTPPAAAPRPGLTPARTTSPR